MGEVAVQDVVVAKGFGIPEVLNGISEFCTKKTEALYGTITGTVDCIEWWQGKELESSIKEGMTGALKVSDLTATISNGAKLGATLWKGESFEGKVGALKSLANASILVLKDVTNQISDTVVDLLTVAAAVFGIISAADMGSKPLGELQEAYKKGQLLEKMPKAKLTRENAENAKTVCTLFKSVVGTVGITMKLFDKYVTKVWRGAKVIVTLISLVGTVASEFFGIYLNHEDSLAIDVENPQDEG